MNACINVFSAARARPLQSLVCTEQCTTRFSSLCDPVSALIESSCMKLRSVVARGLLLLSIGVMAAGCAHTDTKITTTGTADDASSARGTTTASGAGGTRYYV